MGKDWIGNSTSVYSTLGANNHSDNERENNDYYATDPKAVKLLLEKESFSNNILEPCCVDCETEYFNGKHWKKISQYVDGDKVLSYTKNGNTELVTPIKYIKEPYNGMFYYFESQKFSMKLTPNHRVIFYNHYNGKLSEMFAKQVFDKYNSDSNGFRGRIPTSWEDEGSLVVNEWLLRLAVACNADGRTRTKYKKTYEVRVKKERKKERLEYLLNKANIQYKYTYDQKADRHNFSFESPLGNKLFPKEWLNLTKSLKLAVLDEIQYWDGAKQRDATVYFTSKKEDADFIQMLAHSVGESTSIHSDNRSENTNFRVYIRKGTSNGALRKKQNYNNLSMEKSNDDFCYCFTVPSTMLVLRRNNKIFITGNCGGGHIAEVLKDNGYNVMTMDIIDRGYPYTIVQDFLEYNEIFNGDIVTNPPYKISLPIIKHALDIIPLGNKVAMFLKIQFLEGKSRREFFKENPPKVVYVSSSRLNCYMNGDFTNNPSSAVCYCWYIWEKGYKGEPIIRWIN